MGILSDMVSLHMTRASRLYDTYISFHDAERHQYGNLCIEAQTVADKFRRKYKADPMVRVSPQALRAALEHRGMTVADLVRESGESHQTLSNIAAASDDAEKRTRRSRLKKMSGVLQVPQRFLRGQPLTLRRNLDDWQPGFETDYSPRTALAAESLLEQCREACTRDLADARLSTGARAFADQFYVYQLEQAVQALLSMQRWRGDVLYRPAYDEGHVKYKEPTPKTESLWAEPDVHRQHEEAVLGLLRAVTHILQPWFDGKQLLNYGSMVALAERGRQAPLLPIHWRSSYPEDERPPRSASPDALVPAMAVCDAS
jgi:transcriptional regulator with XRE-family HTH domain